MKVCAVIVTYGDRFKYLKQIIDAALKEGVRKIIVVDNNSEIESRDKLRKYEKLLNGKIKVLYLNNNYGSAGGYKRGLEKAYKDPDCEFIWLLDDDNKSLEGSLKILKNFWNDLKHKDKKEKVALLSYRKDRIVYKEAIMTNNPNLVLGRNNSFLGFHIIDVPQKVLKIIKRRLGFNSFIFNRTIKSGKVSVAPYGGMFFHKKLIDTIGYPNENFYLYADDHEWSYRITKSGGDIYLVLNSIIEDINTSWNISKDKKKSFQIIANGNKLRMYYSIRNRVFFESTNLVTNHLIYRINIFIFSCLVKLADKTRQNYKIFKQAIIDGLSGRLGKNENINF